MDQLQKLFSAVDLRLTAPRKAIFIALRSAHHPLSIRDIIEQYPEIDRSSIYRTLEIFGQLGIIEIVHIGWKKRYELAEPFAPHHHHLQCTRCQALVALDTPELETLIETIARTHHYHVTSHHFELHGACQKCQKSV